MYNIEEIANQIAVDDDLYSLINNYPKILEMYPELKNYKFVFGSNYGSVPGFSVNRDFSHGSAVRGLLKKSKVIVLNEVLAKSTASGLAAYQADYSVSLDTQAMSYLVPFILRGKKDKLPKDYVEIFNFLSEDNVQIDPMPYILENYNKFNNEHILIKIKEKLQAYEILKYIDLKQFRENQRIVPYISDIEILNNVEKYISMIREDVINEKRMASHIFEYNIYYAIIMKIVLIQMKTPDAKKSNKIIEFMDFCHSSLHTMYIDAVIIADRYFRSPRNFAFFGKIHKRDPEYLLKLISGMAWDLNHISYLKKPPAFMNQHDRYFFFSSILTTDIRFIEVIEMCALMSYVIRDGAQQIQPFYDQSMMNNVFEDHNMKYIAKRYYSFESKKYREENRIKVRNNIFLIVSELEKDIQDICGKTI